MGLFRVAVLVLVTYIVVRLVAKGFRAAFAARFRAYRLLARRLDGQYESRGMSEPPTVSFHHRGVAIRVGLAPSIPGQPSGPKTRIVARFGPGQPLRLEISPRLRPGPPQEPRGTRQIRLGVPEFDRVYLARSNDPGLAAELLGCPEFRPSLERLRWLAPPAGMLISVSPERFLVQVDRDLDPVVGGLDLAVHEALGLLDALRERVDARMGEGITIEEVGALTTGPGATPSTCKVCGEGIDADGPHVVCAACGSPSHRDCWDYLGGCPIFGCRGTRSVPV